MKISLRLKKKQKHIDNLLNKMNKIQKERKKLISELQSECMHLSIFQYINKKHNIKYRICNICGYKEIVSDNQKFSLLNTNTIKKINKKQLDMLLNVS